MFGRVFNAFDNRFFNGSVFESSGSPFYSRTQTFGDLKQLGDPTRLYSPRRIEAGITWTLGAS